MGHFWAILGHFWAILGHFRSFSGHFLVLIFLAKNLSLLFLLLFASLGYGGAEMQIFKGKTRFLIIQMQKPRSEKLACANFNGKKIIYLEKGCFSA